MWIEENQGSKQELCRFAEQQNTYLTVLQPLD